VASNPDCKKPFGDSRSDDLKLVIDIIIATCAQLPDLDPDDQFLARALEDLGAHVTPAVWEDAGVDWGRAAVCVVRSTWDYHKNHESFSRWVDDTCARTRLLNPPHIVHWNKHKFYLRELERAGVAIVPTFWLKRHETIGLSDLLGWLDWPEAVIKPAYGASADGVRRVGTHPDDRDRAQSYLTSLLYKQDALLQPYLSTIATHQERALVFIDGEYSHAVAKMPFMHANSDLARRACLPPGASGEVAVEATTEEISLATQALEVAPQGHIFARVDLVRNGGMPCVLEVELIEPTLYFYAHLQAARTLAGVIIEPYR
jgi:glutathione synthase/RimK-type ligase-like ATP-grasp enzyme